MISEDENVSFGVPQGSVLGPTLFLVYINDLCDITIPNAKLFSYADDTAVVFTGKSWKEISKSAEFGMAHVSKWLRSNLLTLNTDKTKYICFSITKSTQPEIDMNLRIHSCQQPDTCDCPSIERVNQIKYLGVIVDEHLSWYPQLDQVISRVRKLLWIFRTLRHIVPVHTQTKRDKSRNILNEIYLALVQSVLVYCIPIWGGAAKSRFIHLERAQRALIKVMYFKRIRFPTELLYKISDLLTVRKLYIVQCVLKTHKTVKYDPKYKCKRTIVNVAKSLPSRTTFASSQCQRKSVYVYNKVNKQLDMYSKTYHECKKLLCKWLKPKTYDETESLLHMIS